MRVPGCLWSDFAADLFRQPPRGRAICFDRSWRYLPNGAKRSLIATKNTKKARRISTAVLDAAHQVFLNKQPVRQRTFVCRPLVHFR